MRKYLDLMSDAVYTEEELQKKYEELVNTGEISKISFESYKTGLLNGENRYFTETADSADIERLRNTVGKNISNISGFEYNKVVDLLRELDVFGNWTDWEISYRPVNIEELIEICEERFL